MALIEREHLLSELAALYATAAGGQGRVALVDGGVASGKTELVNAVAELAAADGARVLTAACSLAESTIRLGVVGQLCHGVRAQGDDVRPPGFDVTPDGADAPTLRHDDAQLLESLCQLLLDLAADRPLVIVVDDVQFADPLSLQALLYLQRRIRSARVLLVLSGCVGARPAGAAFHAELTRQPHCRHLRLFPLSRDGVGRLLAERFTPEVARRLAESAHALSGGNPMLVHALADDSGGLPEAPVVGDAFVNAALACLHRSDPRLLDVARALAIAGPRASTELVSALADVTPAATRQALGALAEAGLADGRAFHHPAVRAAVLEDCPPDALAALRLRAARLLHDNGAPAGDVAAQLVAVGEPVEPWAVPVLVAAAQEAVARSDAARSVAAREGAAWDGAAWDGAAWDGAAWDGAAWDGAVQGDAGRDGAVLDGAVRDGAAWDGAVRDGAVRDGAALAGAAWNGAVRDGAGQGDAARDGAVRGDAGWGGAATSDAARGAVARNDVAHAVDFLELALASTDDERRAAAVEAALVRLHWRGKPSGVLRHLSSLLDAARAGLLDGADALLLARSLAWHGRQDDAEDVLAALGDPAAHADPDVTADHLATREWLRHCRPHAADGPAPRDPGPALDHAEEVLQRARPGDSVLVPVWHALRVLIDADQLDRAGDWCERLFGEADARGVTSWRAVLSDVRAAIALRRGDLAAARTHARTALTAMSADSWGVAVGSPLAHLVLACTATGNTGEAEQALRLPTPGAMRRTLFWPTYLRARGVYYDAVERHQAALADFQAAGESAVRWGVDDPSALPWRVDLARVHVRLGRPERARELVAEHLALPGADRPRAKGMGLRALASACAPKQRQAMLSEAMDLLHASGDRHELAHAFADLSQAGHALGEFGRAKMMGWRALQLAEGCHAGLLRKKLQPLHDALNERDSGAVEGFAALSDAERRVVNLAARGHTNREIGHKLFITVSTVEQHLTRAYRKLKISRRTDLVPIGPTEEVFA